LDQEKPGNVVVWDIFAQTFWFRTSCRNLGLLLLQDEQQRKLLEEKEAQARQQQVKLAPWAKKSHHESGNRDLSLAEIQRLEEEREREARIRRELEEQELRERQEAEAQQMRRQVKKLLFWMFFVAIYSYSLLTQDNMRQPEVAFCFMLGATPR
jgi:hypothetical protein